MVIKDLAKLEQEIFDIAAQHEPTILIALRRHKNKLFMTVRVNRGNQQMEKLAMWAWRDLERWHSRSEQAAAQTLADQALGMAKRMQIHEVI